MNNIKFFLQSLGVLVLILILTVLFTNRYSHTFNITPILGLKQLATDSGK